MTDTVVDPTGRGNTNAPPHAREELLARIDVRELTESGDRFLRVFTPRFAEEIALGRYVRALLAAGRWHQVRIVPQREGHQISSHVFDVYGVTDS